MSIYYLNRLQLIATTQTSGIHQKLQLVQYYDSEQQTIIST